MRRASQTEIELRRAVGLLVVALERGEDGDALVQRRLRAASALAATDPAILPATRVTFQALQEDRAPELGGAELDPPGDRAGLGLQRLGSFLTLPTVTEDGRILP